MFKKITIFLITVIFICVTSTTVFAETSSYYTNQKNNANANAAQTQENLNALNGEIDAVLQEVANLDSSILAYESEIAELNTRLNALENSIKEKEADLKLKKETLDQRLVAMYKKKEPTFLDVLLSGELMNFISNQNIVKQVTTYDSNLIEEVERLKTSLENEKNEVTTLKTEKENKTKELQAAKAEKEVKVAALTEEQKQLQAQLSEYKAQAEQYANLERQAIAKEQAAREAAKAAGTNNSSNNVYSYKGGALGWPCPSSSRITSQYGYRILFGVRDFHTGIDIGANMGSNIVAAESGTVILAAYGWNGGYGNYMIINHGNGVTTRYAHASALYVSTGQSVSKGQVIGAVGSTGNSTGPHLHFEVRINGSHQNPLNYL